MRRQVIAGNWKMYNTPSETEDYFSRLSDRINSDDKDVIIFPPFTSLEKAVEKTDGTNIAIGAQNFHYEEEGAFTGEISAKMLKETGVKYVLIGHSERRKYFAETDDTVNKKIKKAFQSGLIPVMCIGEDLAQRESGDTMSVLENQLKGGLEGVSDSSIIIAYEPIWAIGTGKTATVEQAQEACGFIRYSLLKNTSLNSQSIRILYGGSVKAENIRSLMQPADIDGVLVGGASLKEEFADIVNWDK